MKKFLLYAGALAFSIASYATISAFKTKSLQDEGSHYVVVKEYQNITVGEKSYILITYGADKTEYVECEYEPTKNGIKERQEARTKNAQTLNGIFDKLRSQGYHLSASNSGSFVANYVGYFSEAYVFEK